MPVGDVEQAEIDRDRLTSIATSIAQTGTYRPRHRDVINELGLSGPDRQGCDRLVFRTGQKTVIKVPRTVDRIDINYDEVANWSQYGEFDIFAPVLNSGPDDIWLEMVWCRPPENESRAFNQFHEKLDGTPIEIIDAHAENIGWFNGELVCYDYPDIHIRREGFY